jgi:adenylate cyclase
VPPIVLRSNTVSATGTSPDLAGKAAGGRRLIAVVYADMVGYSRLISLDDAGTLRRLRTLRRALIDPTIREYGGKVVQTGGDSLLVAFDSIDGAVRCAVKVQQQVPVYGSDQLPDRLIRFRIGIEIGDAIAHATDLHGDAVNIAARLQTQCPAGGICVSRAVRDYVHGRLNLAFEAIGPLSLKNIDRPIEAYVLRLDPASDKLSRPYAAPGGKQVTRVWRRPASAIVAVALLLCIAAGTGWWLTRGSVGVPSPSPSLLPETARAPQPAEAARQAVAPADVTPPNAPPLSLVVLPFDNLGGDPSDDYLVAGITDDLTTALSHISGTFVISRRTANSFRGKAEDIRRIGQDLGVRYVIQGSVRRVGPILHVNAELGSTESGAELWSDTFDQKVADLTFGQGQIVVRVSEALNIRLTDIEAARSVKERPTNPDAFDLVLRARAVNLLPATNDRMTQTTAFYEQALARDPNSILALTGAVMTVLTEGYRRIISYESAMDVAAGYLGRAQARDPNSEDVLVAQAALLDFEGDGLDWRRAASELEAVSQRLIELYPNNTAGYFRLGVLRRQKQRYDEAAEYFRRSIRLDPRNPFIKSYYWNMAWCRIVAGHDQEGLGWADRTLAAEGDMMSPRDELLLSARIAAYFRLGDISTAERLAAELNDRYPLHTSGERGETPAYPVSATVREQLRSLQDASKSAGVRDHLDAEADFGVVPDDVLHNILVGKTPTTAPGVTTVHTEQLAAMLANEKPLVIDTVNNSLGRSLPGTVGINFHSNTHGTFTDEVQKRLEAKLRTLTGNDPAKPIVALGFNVARFDAYNLALRIRHAGYTNVYWYRGGREAWEVAGLPETELSLQDW